MNLNFLVDLLKIVIVRSIFGLNLKFKVENNNNIFLLRRVKALLLRRPTFYTCTDRIFIF